MGMLATAGLFLPLFPLSMVFNLLAKKLHHSWVRCSFLLLWPHVGVFLTSAAHVKIPEIVVVWAMLTSSIYALRLLTIRDLGLWSAFLVTSSSALSWILLAHGTDEPTVHLFLVWTTFPAGVLTLLAEPLSRRFGSSYAGLHGGLAASLPRLSLMLVTTTLAAIATPPFPGFFALLGLLRTSAEWPVITLLTLVWIIWSWAAARMIQGFLAGTPANRVFNDMKGAPVLTHAITLGLFAASGLYMTWNAT